MAESGKSKMVPRRLLMAIAVMLMACSPAGREPTMTDSVASAPVDSKGSLSRAWSALADRVMSHEGRHKLFDELLSTCPDEVFGDMALAVASPAGSGFVAGLSMVLRALRSRPHLRAREDVNYVVDALSRLCLLHQDRASTGWKLSLDDPNVIIVYYYLESAWIQHGVLTEQEGVRCRNRMEGLRAGFLTETRNGVSAKRLTPELPLRRLAGRLYMMLGHTVEEALGLVEPLVLDGAGK